MLAPYPATGDVVIMDNLAAHEVHGVRETIEANGAGLLYLQLCSPDLDTIENAFAEHETLLRKAAGRTIEGL